MLSFLKVLPVRSHWEVRSWQLALLLRLRSPFYHLGLAQVDQLSLQGGHSYKTSPKTSAGHNAPARIKCQWERGARPLGWDCMNRRPMARPGLSSHLASACGLSDVFYAEGLYAEGTEVAKGEQSRALFHWKQCYWEKSSQEGIYFTSWLWGSRALPSARPQHKGKVDNPPEIALATYQQARDTKSLP